MSTSVRRVLAVSGLSLGMAALAGACSAAEDSSTPPTITILPQSYTPKAPASVAPQSTTAATAGGDGTTDQPQNYTVEAGDYPSTVAEKFEITLDELLNFNDWELQGDIVVDFPPAGEVIRIPPGAKFIDPNAPAEEDEETTEDTTSNGGTTSDGAIIETTPASVIADASADRCVPGNYTLEEGDYPGQVAGKFDVTVEALNEANATTQGYNAFYVGLEIIIPAANDC